MAADRRFPEFPIAEVDADGSAVITKHDDTGGLHSVARSPHNCLGEYLRSRLIDILTALLPQ